MGFLSDAWARLRGKPTRSERNAMRSQERAARAEQAHNQREVRHRQRSIFGRGYYGIGLARRNSNTLGGSG